jgi:hypothetical protein
MRERQGKRDKERQSLDGRDRAFGVPFPLLPKKNQYRLREQISKPSNIAKTTKGKE